jgi:hypothetical protein
MTFRVDELEAVRKSASGLGVPACAERLLDLRGVLEPRDEVEIVVRPRLLAEQCVDRPAPSSQIRIPTASRPASRSRTRSASISA